MGSRTQSSFKPLARCWFVHVWRMVVDGRGERCQVLLLLGPLSEDMYWAVWPMSLRLHLVPTASGRLYWVR